ncbi:MAG: trimethylamine methyltransferase family protein [Bacillota bacterium]|jgi:trimethylamine--corrinoid protein Co-methyltransferase
MEKIMNQEIGALTLLSKQQLVDVHEASLQVLDEVGVVIHHKGALKMLKKAGAAIDGDRVRLPRELIDWALAQAPSSITLYNRDKTPALHLEGFNNYFGTGSDCYYILDTNTGKRRRCNLKDVENAVRLCDALENISYIMSMCNPAEVPAAFSDIYQYREMLKHTIKPNIYSPHNLRGTQDCIAMSIAVAGGLEELKRYPHLLLYAEPTSPLQLGVDSLDKLLYVTGLGLPTIYSAGLIPGATSPVTVAGALTQANAEFLAGLVIGQLNNPGTPMVYGSGHTPMDMRTMIGSYGAPEGMLSLALVAEMARFYNLPSWGYAGCTDAKVVDQQAAGEAANWILLCRLAGSNLIHDVGYMDSALTISLELITICDEFIGMTQPFRERVNTDPEALAVEVIKQVGPGGHFLDHIHTLENFRQHKRPELANRKRYEDWVKDGEKTMLDLAREKVARILREHNPEPLPKEVVNELDRIIERRINEGV